MCAVVSGSTVCVVVCVSSSKDGRRLKMEDEARFLPVEINGILKCCPIGLAKLPLPDPGAPVK